MSKPITEKDGVHKEWYVEAKEQTLKTLPAFLAKLTGDYQHDYGTICHAVAAAAVAAAWAVEHSPQGGITGFQAGAVGWQFLTEWGSPGFDHEIGARLLSYGDLLYPQYEDKWRTLSHETMELVRAKARRLSEENADFAADSVREHWRFLASGGTPFGLRVTPRPAEEERT